MKTALIIIAIAAMAFVLGYEHGISRHDALSPTQTVYVPACGPMPLHVRFDPISMSELTKHGR